MDAIGEALATALRRISEVVGEQAGRGLGREVVGRVPGRPESEDVEIGIDSRCDAIFIESLQDTGVTVRVYSEHGEDLVGSGEPEYVVAVDPLRRLRAVPPGHPRRVVERRQLFRRRGHSAGRRGRGHPQGRVVHSRR